MEFLVGEKEFQEGAGPRDLSFKTKSHKLIHLSQRLRYDVNAVQVGCFARLGIYEENARFILISLLLVLYLIIGAFLFNYVERENEIEERRQACETLFLKVAIRSMNTLVTEGFQRFDVFFSNDVIKNQNSGLRESYQTYPATTKVRKHRLDHVCDSIRVHGGVRLGQAWSLSPNGIHLLKIAIQECVFEGCSTQNTEQRNVRGFGSSTPRTDAGRVLTILYGVVGCTSCVLFFNLFLERFVTALSYLLRYFHERKIQRRMMKNSSMNKPVTLLINNEDYCESASFATIGFGDYVSNQKDVTKINGDLYRQFLNFMIKKMDVKGTICCLKKKRRYMGLGLRPPKELDISGKGAQWPEALSHPGTAMMRHPSAPQWTIRTGCYR
ncbi:hypothetical protein TELCIR_06209 [Teladorsagia circumcincta]|uniref:Potassium channel domain-containing protein n=1 Tax=Teladorsagia circumcincta TaxID=45464 RepID=A0A2G9UNK6_TELCI|nr:hypothetical protein TELCIR_06209 [Teladorsagia circumcincta]